MSDQRAPTAGRLASALLVGVYTVGCGSATTPVSVTGMADLVPTAVAPALTTVPTMTGLAPSPTRPADPTATESTGPLETPAALSCEAARQWSQTRGDLTLSMCFEPYPPQLGILTSYEAVLVNSAGQPLSDAEIELTMVGGVASMVGEYDEDFSVALESQGAGLYRAVARVGHDDLVVTGVRVDVQYGEQSWTFSLTADDLPLP